MGRGKISAGLAGVAALLWLLAAPQAVQADLFGTDGAEEPAAAAVEPSPDAAEQPVTAEELAAALPREWRGTFLWHEGAAYYIELEIVSVEVSGGEVGFTAESRWLPGELEARMSGRINPATLGVAVWEIPSGDSVDGFQSDGLYSGVLARDLWDLRADWMTTTTGATGTLVLVAKALPGP